MHGTELCILFVSMYYRSMKENTKIELRNRIHWPALLSISLVFICMLISLGCTIYNLYNYVMKMIKTRKA